MAQSPAAIGGRGGWAKETVVGDYKLVEQIGSGSFSVVWRAIHRFRKNEKEVAVKEIAMGKLSKKLQESLRSEIVILRRISHPNIITLHDIVEASGRIYLILEHCEGDLSAYIQRHGKIPEATAKHFMRQLATGLQVLRENNLIHRDLKPQNLLLVTLDGNSVLKIADFGFARSLQPSGLAETMCGSPLYMAPEIMQFQKYDAKADLWSVGAILFQLVTGKTPFTGNSQPQLLQNILNSNEIRFPPDNNLSYDCMDLCKKLLRRNPVERLTFEEFFNHYFLSQHSSDKSLSRTSSSTRDEDRSSPARHSVESSQDESLPFILDDESNSHEGSPSVPTNNKGSTYGSYADNPSKIGVLSRYSHDYSRSLRGNAEETELVMDQRPLDILRKDSTVVDSLEFIDQDYVLVPGPPFDMSSCSVSASQQRNSESSPKNGALSAPMPIVGAATREARAIGSLESHSSSQGSMDLGDAMEQPSAHYMTRISSLQRCASVITELVKEEAENGKRLEAFSIQLVVLAIWKQALHVCHAQAAASATEGSPSLASVDSQEIERGFLVEIGHAEELARDLGEDGTAEMPDAIEMIFQSALSLGRRGAVDEMMDNTERAACRYSRAVCLLHFLLVEAPSLVLNPPFSLTSTDRYRLRLYINMLNNRHGQPQS